MGGPCAAEEGRMSINRKARGLPSTFTLLPAALALLAAITPAAERWWAARSLAAPAAVASPGPLPARLDRLGPLLASWQTVGGCGASAATGAGVGVKWIGRNVTGGLFGVQTVGSYSPPAPSDARAIDHQFFLTTLVTRDLGDAWQLGVNVPVVYKYMRDPYGLNIDLSNGGLGDVFVQMTHKLGTIHDTLVTAALGLPTGKHDQIYKMQYLRQHQQLGFGKVAGSLTVDHNIDETWGLVVVGASGAWRGGKNDLANYRAPSGSAYTFAGYFLGPLVPSLGLSVTGFTAHDRDRDSEENTGLFVVAPTASLEWSTDWVAVLLGASLPYQYDGVRQTAEGAPRSPWNFGAWSVTLGLSFSPF
jgi:hypothetical protein